MVGKGGHSLHFRSILIIFYFTLTRLKGTLKFVLTYIICSVFLSKTYRKKLISTLYFFKKSYWFLLKCSLGIKIIHDWVKSALNEDEFFSLLERTCRVLLLSNVLHFTWYVCTFHLLQIALFVHVSTCTNTWIS